MTQINWGDITSAAGDDGKVRVPDGAYDVQITSTFIGMTGNGDPKVTAHMKVTSGPYMGGIIRKDFILGTSNTTAQKILVEHLEALGITRDYLNTHQPTDEQLAEILKGCTASVLLGTRIWSGKEYDDVKSIKPLAGGSGFAFGSGLPGGSVLNLVTGGPMPSGPVPAVPSVPVPVVDTVPAVPTPPVPVSVGAGESGLPPEPPF